MLDDPYAVLRALLRAEAARRTPESRTGGPQAPSEPRPPALEGGRD